MCKGFGGGIFNYALASDTAAMQAKVNKARVAARDAKNERSVAENDLARFNQTLNNKKIMDRAGKNYATLSGNLARRLDAAAYGDTMTRLALSEEMGAVAASAAAAGVGGSSVENYNRTIQTSYALQKELSDRQLGVETFALNEARGDVMTEAVDSLDRTIYSPNLDRTYYGPTKGPSIGSHLVTLGLAAAATAAGAPQIGEAIIRQRTANMQADYGDAAGAAKSFDGALNAFKGGVGEIRDSMRGGGDKVQAQSFSFAPATEQLRGLSTATSQFGADGVNFNSISFR